jgi:hypothetical protein
MIVIMNRHVNRHNWWWPLLNDDDDCQAGELTSDLRISEKNYRGSEKNWKQFWEKKKKKTKKKVDILSKPAYHTVLFRMTHFFLPRWVQVCPLLPRNCCFTQSLCNFSGRSLQRKADSKKVEMKELRSAEHWALLHKSHQQRSLTMKTCSEPSCRCQISSSWSYCCSLHWRFK